MDNVDSVAASTIFSLAVRQDGTLWAWGSKRWYTGLGDGSTDFSRTPVRIMNNVMLRTTQIIEDPILEFDFEMDFEFDFEMDFDEIFIFFD